ncbi:hypothetical protein FOZ63_021378, partial [Perkinsus olseni]
GDGHTEDSISPPREQSAVEDFHSVAETPGGRRRRIYDVNDGHIHEDETAARRELEDNIGCKVRSKGSPYVRKDGSRVRKYVCSYADRKGWKRCRFGALIVERATDGRFEIEAESIHPPHEPSGEAMPVRIASEALAVIDQHSETNAKPSMIKRVLRQKNLAAGVPNVIKSINNRKYRNKTGLRDHGAKLEPGSSRAELLRYCSE